MESTDKLREYGHDCCARIDDAIHDYCDEIEREIAERYMELPVDADGVSIPIDDFNAACDHYGFVKERTCKNLSHEFAVFHCSECGYFERDCACARYCPNCGAKVVGE